MYLFIFYGTIILTTLHKALDTLEMDTHIATETT